MDGPDIPPFFICPISLQIMKDPVTLITGMTYDRESINSWFFTYNHNTCPVTKQPVTDHNLTPNTTLLRLIQSWRVENPSNVVSMVQTPRPNFDVAIFRKLVDDVREPQSQISQIRSLRKIRSLIQDSDDNRRYVEEAGLASLMAYLITDTDPQGISISHFSDSFETIEEAMKVLYVLKPSPEALKKVAEEKDRKIIDSLSLVMQRGSYQGRIQAVLLLQSIFKVVGDKFKIGLKAELFDGVVEILKDQNSNNATKAALLILMEVTQFGKNMTRAVEAGVMAVLVELLAEINERQICEIMLRVLEIMCGTAEGRAAFVAHPASVAAVSSKILRVSQVANERAVKLLLQLCRFCGSSGFVQEMVEMGAVTKVCLVVQAQCSQKTKDMAKEILGLHVKIWNKSPCFPANMIR